MSWRRPRVSSTASDPRAEVDAGLTLVDALVGLAIAIFLMAALGIFVLFQNRKLGAEAQTVSAQQGMRATLELIEGDLREAGRRASGAAYTSEPSPPGLCVTEANRIRVTRDRDGDGATSGPDEDVTYCLCGGSGPRGLYRAYRPQGGSSFLVERIAEKVSALDFTYAPRSVSVAMAVSVITPIGTVKEGARMTAFLRNLAQPVTCASGPTCPPAGCG